MSIIKKLAGQTAIYGIPSILARTLNFLLAYIHLDVFVPDNYGIITELYAYVAFVMVFLLYGMETAFFRFVQQTEESKVFNTLQSSLYLSSGLFLLAVFLQSSGIAASLGYSADPWYIKCLAVIMILDVLTAMPLVRLRHREKPLIFVCINLSGILVNIGLNLFVFLYWFGNYKNGNTEFFLSEYFDPTKGITYVFMANLAGSAVKYLISLAWGIPNPLKFDFPLWLKSLKYSWPLVITGLAGLVNEVADRAMLKNLLAPKIGMQAALYQLGIYGACYKLSLLINICVQAFRYAAEPFFFKQIKGRSDQSMVTILNYLAGFVLLVFISVSLFIDFFKLFIRTEEYWQGLDVVPILLLANCFLALHIQISMWYKLSDKTKFGAMIAGAAAVITIIGNFILVPILGYMGAAIITLVVYAFLPTCSFLLSKRHYYVPYQIKKLLLYFSTAIIIVLLGYYLFPDMHLALKALLLLIFIAVFCLTEKADKQSYANSDHK